MAWQEEAQGMKVNFQLATGQTPAGAVTTSNVSIGQLNPAAWDLGKFGNINNIFEMVFLNSIYNVQRVITNRLYNDE